MLEHNALQIGLEPTLARPIPRVFERVTRQSQIDLYLLHDNNPGDASP
jgi:uncharacterized protein YndB with AHSA1/START domain